MLARRWLLRPAVRFVGAPDMRVHTPRIPADLIFHLFPAERPPPLQFVDDDEGLLFPRDEASDLVPSSVTTLDSMEGSVP